MKQLCLFSVARLTFDESANPHIFLQQLFSHNSPPPRKLAVIFPFPPGVKNILYALRSRLSHNTFISGFRKISLVSRKHNVLYLHVHPNVAYYLDTSVHVKVSVSDLSFHIGKLFFAWLRLHFTISRIPTYDFDIPCIFPAKKSTSVGKKNYCICKQIVYIL